MSIQVQCQSQWSCHLWHAQVPSLGVHPRSLATCHGSLVEVMVNKHQSTMRYVCGSTMPSHACVLGQCVARCGAAT